MPATRQNGFSEPCDENKSLSVMSTFLEIDGSEGEGGGQILRSSLALSLLTSRPFRLINIRAKRRKPGLAAQHLASIKAASAICNGLYKGAVIGSSVLYFEPNGVASGDYAFSIGTAGATSLVLHTVCLPLALKGTSQSRVTITGGTHVAHSPSYHFLESTWLGYIKKMGLNVELAMKQPGFYPRGGGEISAVIHPATSIRSLMLTARPTLTTAGGFSAVAGLPEGIANRQARRVSFRLSQAGLDCHICQECWNNGPASNASIIFRQAAVPTLFSALGERGKPAERVADEVADEAIAFRDSGAAVDPYSADQIVLPLVFAEAPSEFRVSRVSLHLTTNIATIRKFVDRRIDCSGGAGESGTVRIH